MSDVKETAGSLVAPATLEEAIELIKGLLTEKEELKAQLEALGPELEKLKKEAEELTKKGEELQAQLGEAKEAPAKKDLVVKIAEKDIKGTYRVLAPKVHLPGVGDVTAEELIAEPKMVAELIRIQSGLIEKID